MRSPELQDRHLENPDKKGAWRAAALECCGLRKLLTPKRATALL